MLQDLIDKLPVIVPGIPTVWLIVAAIAAYFYREQLGLVTPTTTLPGTGPATYVQKLGKATKVQNSADAAQAIDWPTAAAYAKALMVYVKDDKEALEALQENVWPAIGKPSS